MGTKKYLQQRNSFHARRRLREQADEENYEDDYEDYVIPVATLDFSPIRTANKDPQDGVIGYYLSVFDRTTLGTLTFAAKYFINNKIDEWYPGVYEAGRPCNEYDPDFIRELLQPCITHFLQQISYKLDLAVLPADVKEDYGIECKDDLICALMLDLVSYCKISCEFAPASPEDIPDFLKS